MVLLLAAVVVAVCAAVQGAVGFGLNLLAVPALLVLDPQLVPGPMLVAGLALSLLVARRELGAIDRRVGSALIGYLPGAGLGLLLLSLVPEDSLGVPLGLLVLLVVGISALSWSPRPTWPALVTAGLASGFLSTSAAIGGPPVALLYARDTGPRLRSTLSFFFVASAVISLVVLGLVGRFRGHDVVLAAVLLPGVLVGFLVSGPLRPYVDAGRSRRLVLGVSALAAVLAIVQGAVG